MKTKFKSSIGIKDIFFLSVILLCSVFWLFKGNTILESLFEDPTSKFIERASETLKETDPQAAKTLAGIAGQRDKMEWAKAFTAREQVDGLSGVRALTKKIEEGRVVYEKVLADLASRPRAFKDVQERDSFIRTYSEYFEPLEAVDWQAADEKGRFLEEIAGNANHWNIVKDDPIALVMFHNGVFDGSERLLSFYSEHRDWLQTPLLSALVYLSDNESGKVSENTAFLKNSAIRAMQFYPASKAFAEIEEDDGFAFAAVFLDYAHVLAPAVSEWHLPPDEVSAVVFSNQDQFQPIPVDEDVPPEAILEGKRQAQELAYLWERNKFLWEKAQEESLVLRFYKDSGETGEKLLDKYPGLPDFIYSQYPQEAVQAIRAVSLYSDMALLYLQKYAEVERMHELLRTENIGFRIFPMLFQFGDRALDLVEENRGWLDRYVKPDGTPRDQGWLMSLPFVGAPLQVVSNWRNGYPNTWGELGWAAFDVAGTVSLVTAFSKAVAKEVVQEGVEQTGRTAAKTLMGRLTAQKAAAATGRAVQTTTAAAGKRTLLGKYTAVLLGGVARGTGRGIAFAWTQTTRAVRSLSNPVVRKWVSRGVLAVYLTVTLDERTIPGLPELGTKIGETMGRTVRSAAQATGNVFSGALITALNIDSPEGRSALVSWIKAAVWFVFIILCVWLLRRRLSWR